MSEAKTELTLEEAAVQYALSKARLPSPGQEFRGPEDAVNFKAYADALLELERAAMRAAHGVQVAA